MKKFFTISIVWLFLSAITFSLNAAPDMPQISSGATEYWYHVVFQRYNANLSMQDNGDDALLIVETLVLNQNNQLWKVEAGAVANQYILISKAGRKVYWDAGTSRFKAGATTTEIKLITSPNTTYTNSWEVQRDGSTTMAMNPFGGSSAGKSIGEWTVGDGGNPVKFVSLAIALQNKITEATNKLSNTKEGADPGTFTSASRTTLQGAITAAQGVYNNVSATDTDRLNAYNALNNAITTYQNEVILPVLSTAGNDKWYFIQGTRPANTYITDNTANAFITDAAVIPNDTQLWKLVANTNGSANGFALVNKATGEYINADIAATAELQSIATMPTNNLKFVASDIYTNKVVRFWIENEAGSTPALRFHAGGTGNSSRLMNYTGDRYDNSSWLFLDYAVALKVFLQTAITDAQNALVNIPEGTDIGQNPASERTTLSNAITAAQAVYNDPAASESAIINATSTLNAATAVYKTAASNLQRLLSATTGRYRFYRFNNRNYDTNDILTVNGVATDGTGTPVCQNKDTNPDSEMWVFQVNEANDAVKIISPVAMKAIKEYDYQNSAKLVDITEGSWFRMTQIENTYWAFGNTFISDAYTGYHFLHCNSSRSLVSWDVAGNASHWTLEFVKEDVMTGVNTQLNQPAYTIRTVNNVITVDGVENFDVFSISGQKLNKLQSVRSGLYIVKIGNQSFKVNVQ